MEQKPDAVLLLSFGGPEGPDEVMPFLRNVTAGRNVPDERLAVVAEQYAHFGGRSPINDLSRDLAEALKVELASFDHDLPVYWGTRNWKPYLVDTVRQMATDGVKNALVFTDSAYASYSGCRQYQENLEAAAGAVASEGLAAPELQKLRQYFNHPGFIDSMAHRVIDALDEHGSAADASFDRTSVRLVFTAHSIPLAMAGGCDYEEQLREAASLVVDRLGPDRPTQYDVVYQSRSGPPVVPWLEPDVGDHLRSLDPNQPVTVIPIGFTQDHTEVLHDLDILAAAAASDAGLSMTRAKTVGTHPQFIKMIRELIEEEVEGGARLALGSSGPLPAHHGDSHCRSGAASRPAQK